MNPAQSAAASVGPPVNPVLGVHVLADEEDLDFTLEGPLPLLWQRSYRSTNNHAGWFGRGWSCQLEVSLQAVPDPSGQTVDHVDCVDVFGRRIQFPYVSPGGSSFLSSEGTTLSRSTQGQYRLETGDGLSYWFSDRSGSTHRLVALTDRNGNAIHLDFREADGNVETVYITCSGKQQLELRFRQSRLREVVEQRGRGERSVTLARYEYTAHGDLCKVLNRANECMRTFEYNADRLIQHQTYAGTFEAWYEYSGTDKDSRVTKHWDNVGQCWTFEYRGDHTAVIDQSGHTSLYHFDAQRRWTGYTDPLGRLTRYGLDRNGNPRAVIDPAEHVTETLFDERNNPVEQRDATGAVTMIEWHPSFDLPIAITDPLNRTERYEYDARGNLVLAVDPTGAETHYQVDERGLPVAITDARGGTSRLQYNDLGQITRYTDCSARETNFEYDDNGWLTCITDALGQRTTYDYDPAGRLQRETLADGTFEHYESDLADRVVSMTNSLGATMQFRYAPDGLLIQQIDPLGQSLHCRYSPSRQLVELVNENGASYRFSYDMADQLLEESRFDGSKTCYEYDQAGQIVLTVDAPNSPEAITTHYRRDAVGRLLERSTAAGRTTFRYDAAGQLVEANSSEVRVRIQFDKAGRIVEEWISAPGRVHALQHTYDPLGNRLSTTLPGGVTLGTLYYGSEYAHQIRLGDHPVADFERDALHREISRTQGALITNWHYDPVGRLRRQLTHRTGGNTSGRGFKADGSTEIDRTYDYDNGGRLTTAVDRGKPQSYAYDALDRLTRFNDEHFIFDPAHNMLPGSNGRGGAATGAIKDNRLAAFSDKRYRYDAHGRLVEKRVGAETIIQLVWNEEHRLVQSSMSDATGTIITAYLYDPFGRRIAKRSPQGTTWFIWDEDLLIQESSAHTECTFMYEPDSHVPLAHAVTRHDGDQQAQIHYYHCDQVGLPRELTDTDGQVTWEGAYRGWGLLEDDHTNARPAAQDPAAPLQRLRYQGQYFDAETGLHYNFLRYYDPDCGRYISRDPIGLVGGTNEYLYAFSPAGWIDPLGLTGTYLMSGGKKRNYAGKGPRARSLASQRARLKGCAKKALVHKDYGDDEMGFMVEYLVMKHYKARTSTAWANSPRVESPGKKKYAKASTKRKAEARRKAKALRDQFEAEKKKCGL